METMTEGFEKAKETLHKCSTKHGMHASAGEKGYNSVWARDSMIALIGASVADKEKEFKKQFKITLGTLAMHQSKTGQIPNDVDMWDKSRRKQATFATIDSTLWYLLGVKAYSKAYRDKSVERQHKKKIEKAFQWLDCQDAGEDHIPEQLPTCDWQDCFPHKYGHTANTAALYYGCLVKYGKKKEARILLKAANGLTHNRIEMFHPKGFVRPWIWKNHDGALESEDWFDSLGNSLAVCTGFASKKQAKSIVEYAERKKISSPFPIRAIWPPIKKGGREWQPYFSKCLAASPNWYINGGIWPFIGGFYVAALVKAGMREKAAQHLESLAKANKLGKKEWEFNEWVHPVKKKAMGSSYHAWSAGAYILAFESVRKNKIQFF